MLWIVGVSLIMALVSGAPIAAVVAGSATILIMACVQSRHAAVFRVAGTFLVFAASHCFFAQQLSVFEGMGLHDTRVIVLRILTSDFLLTMVAGITAAIGAIIANGFYAGFVSPSDLPPERRRDDDADKN